MDNALKQISATFWDKQSTEKPISRLRWWESKLINQHISRNYCGKPYPDTAGGDIELLRMTLRGGKFKRAISVGGGVGFHEMALLKADLVEHFDLYEISTERVAQGQQRALAQGLADRITFHQQDAFEAAPKQHYDLVYWHDSLHHMLDTPFAVRWSRDVLVSGGVFYINDYVGESYMQWSERTLDLAEKARSCLAPRYLASPQQPGTILPTRRLRPNLANFKKLDPTECADSARILPSVREIFPGCHITHTGGVVYSIALSDILANMDEEADASLIRSMMIMDDFCIAMGESLYAVVVGVKSGD